MRRIIILIIILFNMISVRLYGWDSGGQYGECVCDRNGE